MRQCGAVGLALGLAAPYGWALVPWALGGALAARPVVRDAVAAQQRAREDVCRGGLDGNQPSVRPHGLEHRADACEQRAVRHRASELEGEEQSTQRGWHREYVVDQH